jgi:hypothetical protein
MPVTRLPVEPVSYHAICVFNRLNGQTGKPANQYLYYFIRKRRINLAHDLFIGKMLEINRICGALGVADAVPFTENRINNGLSALGCLMKLYRTIGTGGDTGPARYAIAFIYRANGS